MKLHRRLSVGNTVNTKDQCQLIGNLCDLIYLEKLLRTRPLMGEKYLGIFPWLRRLSVRLGPSAPLALLTISSRLARDE